MHGLFAYDSEVANEFVDGAFDDGLGFCLYVFGDGLRFFEKVTRFFLQPDL